MKHKILFPFLCLIGLCITNAADAARVYVYGVDFTSAKVYGADETTEQFKEAFEGINLLLMKEPKKYNFSSAVGDNVLKPEMILNMTKEADFSDIMTLDKDLKPIQTAAKVKHYPLKETSGNGFILIATLLDKSTNTATYKMVLFDVETRKILKEKEFTGKAGGFGLRNFWARTVYTAAKKFKFD